MMRGNQQFGRARLDHAETKACERMVLMLGETDMNVRRQARGADRSEQTAAQIRKRVEHGGDEHIARHASDRVKMDVHSEESRKRRD